MAPVEHSALESFIKQLFRRLLSSESEETVPFEIWCRMPTPSFLFLFFQVPACARHLVFFQVSPCTATRACRPLLYLTIESEKKKKEGEKPVATLSLKTTIPRRCPHANVRGSGHVQSSFLTFVLFYLRCTNFAVSPLFLACVDMLSTASHSTVPYSSSSPRKRRFV